MNFRFSKLIKRCVLWIASAPKLGIRLGRAEKLTANFVRSSIERCLADHGNSGSGYVHWQFQCYRFLRRRPGGDTSLGNRLKVDHVLGSLPLSLAATLLCLCALFWITCSFNALIGHSSIPSLLRCLFDVHCLSREVLLLVRHS